MVAPSRSAAHARGAVVALATIVMALWSRPVPAQGAGGPQSPADLAPHPVGGWGIDVSARDPNVKPGDDFFMSQVGTWYAHAVVPPTMTAAGPWYSLRIQAVWRDQAMLEAAAANRAASPASAAGQLGAFYRAYMDEQRIEALGLAPLRPELDAIREATTRARIAALMGDIEGPGTVRAINSVLPLGRGLYSIDIQQDRKNPSRYMVSIASAGLMLSAASQYVDPKSADIKHAYEGHVARMLALIGWPDAERLAPEIVAFETRIAKAELADHDARAAGTHRDLTVGELAQLAPGFDWRAFLKGAQVPSPGTVRIDSRTAVAQLAAIFAATPVPVLQARLAFAVVALRAPLLPAAIRAESFEFRTATVNGKGAAPAPRSRTATLALQATIGEALGALYVAQYVPSDIKARGLEMATALRSALHTRIEHATWVGAITRTKMLDKLAKLTVKIGYPDRFETYDGLTINDTDAYGDMVRVTAFNWRRLVRRLGQPVDRAEWTQAQPQTVNTFGSSSLNDAGVPAGLLQPPFFDPTVDAAVNYGGIGAFMGSAIIAGFNDRHFDGDGRQVDWWTDNESRAFDAEGKKLSAQYAAFEPLPGLHLNGDQTLGGSLNDLGGLLLALDAYHLSLHGAPAPIIDGLTGDQRFFMSWAHFWKLKFRPEFIRNQVAIDPNSPAIQRANGTVRNIDAWYAAFDVKPGDKLYIAPAERVRIW